LLHDKNPSKFQERQFLIAHAIPAGRSGIRQMKGFSAKDSVDFADDGIIRL
jgi:hypothetical protein